MSSSNRSDSSLRGPQWLYDALWTSCVEPAVPKCYINIPLTFLFKNGLPYKALVSDVKDGTVARVNVDEVDIHFHVGEKAFTENKKDFIRIYRKLLIEYSVQNSYSIVQMEKNIVEPMIVTVIYADEMREDLTLKMFDVLVRKEAWRKQVLLLQGYIPALSKQSGYYSSQGKKKVRSLLDEDAEAADILTKTLAKYAENAFYTYSTNQSYDTISANSIVDSNKHTKLKVRELRVSFALDPGGRVMCLYSELVAVDLCVDDTAVNKAVQDKDRMVGAAIESDNSKKATANIIKTLQDLLLDAQQQGLPITESFAHFDPRGSGYIDADMLIDGLARLGMGVTYTIAESILETIGGVGAGLISLNDFKTLVTGQMDVQVFHDSTVEQIDQVVAQAKLSKTKKMRNSLRPPKKLPSNSSLRPKLPPLKYDDVGSIMYDSVTTNGITFDEYYSVLGESVDDSSSDVVQQQSIPAYHTSKSTGNLLLLSSTIPADDYRVNPNTVSMMEELPSWTSSNNKKALQELKQSHAKWIKKQQLQQSDVANTTDDGSSSISSSSITCGNTLRLTSPINTSVKRSSTPGRSSNGKRSPTNKTRVDTLNLSTIEQHLQTTKANQLFNLKDEFYQEDDSTVTTYRMLSGQGVSVLEHRNKMHEKLEVFRYKSILEERVRNLELLRIQRLERDGSEISPEEATLWGLLVSDTNGNSSNEYEVLRSTKVLKQHRADRYKIFTVVVVPDLFMSLETMQKHLEQILVKYPLAHLVLVGLPGLPNTGWSGNGNTHSSFTSTGTGTSAKGDDATAKSILNSDKQALSIAKLMHHLRVSHKLSNSPGAPIFLMGLGTGFYSISRFISYYLPSLPWLKARIKAVVSVNGFLKVTKSFRNKCKELYKCFTNSIAHEVNELIALNHFWEGYYTAVGKKKCMEDFWATRRGLSTSSNGDANGGNSMKLVSKLQYKGIMDQLNGFITTPMNEFDGTCILSDSSIPIIVVQSTEDCFINPQNASVYSKESIGPSRVIVDDIEDCIQDNSIYIHWIKAGHELIQERPQFLLGIISNLGELFGAYASVGEAVEEVIDEEMFDVAALAAKRKKAADDKQAAIEQEAYLYEERLNSEKKRLLMEKKLQKQRQKAEHAAAVDREEHERKNSELQDRMNQEKHSQLLEESKALERLNEEEEENERKRSVAAKQSIERDKRSRLLEEKKRRELKAARMKELEVLYEMVRLENEHKHESMELKMMSKEDNRSRHAGNYYCYLQLISTSIKRAATRKVEVAAGRREQAIKKVEEQMSRQRGIRIAERKRKAEEALNDLESIGFYLVGKNTLLGYEVDTGNPNAPQAYTTVCDRVMTDLLYLRQQTLECLKRQALVQEKMDVFMRQLTSVQHDSSEIRQRIRLMAKSPKVYTKADIEVMKRKLAAKEETYQELSALMKPRELQVKAANKSVIKLKLLYKETDYIMRCKLDELQSKDGQYTDLIKQTIGNKESLTIDKDRIRIDVAGIQEKMSKVNKEMKRMKATDSEYIDTDVWMDGVLQRVEKKALLRFLKGEQATAMAKLTELQSKLEDISIRIFQCQEDIDRYTRSSDKFVIAYKVFNKAYVKFSSVSMHSIVKSMHDSVSASSRNANVNDGMSQHHDVAFDAAMVPAAVAAVRAKDGDLRSKDERRFVGVDFIMNPDVYASVSIIEAEQMQFDDDYQWRITKEEFQRILKLSPDINLALPFLRSNEEILAHRILNMFIRGIDDATMMEKDHCNTVTSYEVEYVNKAVVKYNRQHGIKGMIADKDTLKEAAIIENNLVKELQRDRIRGLFDRDDMPDEYRDWRQLDRIIAPHIYGKEEYTDLDVTEAGIVGNLIASSIVLPTSDRIIVEQDTTRLNQRDTSKDGNIYNELRWHYENGDVVFDNSWRCPFDRQQLLQIHHTPIDDIVNTDVMRVKRLLDKYYVTDDETAVGRARVQVLYDVSNQIRSILDGTVERENAIKTKATAAVAAAVQVGEMKHAVGEDRDEVGEIFNSSSVTDRDVVRVWGSWNAVHPASAGVQSQEHVFLLSEYDPSKYHPGAYAVYDNTVVDQLDEAIKTINQASSNLNAGDSHRDHHPNDPNSTWFLVDSVKELAMQDPKKVQNKTVMLPNPDVNVLMQVENATLLSRQSRAHRFYVDEDTTARVLSITCIVTYEGNLGKKVGRLAAAMYLVPEDSDDGTNIATPIPVGYAPYSMQSLNVKLPSHDTPGRVVILHKPHSRPLRASTFQIVIGCASPTKYSIEVHCTTAKYVAPLVYDQIEIAKQMQVRLPICLEELESLSNAWRMIERKLLVCDKLIAEAENECKRCQRYMAICNEKLDLDAEDLHMYEDEKTDLVREVQIYELEYAQAAINYRCRVEERDEIKGMIKVIFELQRQRQQEKTTTKAVLEEYRHVLPACIAVIGSYVEASQVAAELNTSVYAGGNPAAATIGLPTILTPAEAIRRRVKHSGFLSLEVDEQKWCLLDQSLNPSKYEYMRAEVEELNNHRLKQGLKPVVVRYGKVVEEFRLRKEEIHGILATPVNLLTKREGNVRKLVKKYHDDEQVLKKRFTEAAFGYDSLLAERTRIKNQLLYSSEEKMWASVDRILHKDVWSYYVNKTTTIVSDVTKKQSLKQRRKENKLLKETKEGSDASVHDVAAIAPSTVVAVVAADTPPIGDDKSKKKGKGFSFSIFGGGSKAKQATIDEDRKRHADAASAAVEQKKQQQQLLLDRIEDRRKKEVQMQIDRSKKAEEDKLLWTCKLSKDEIVVAWKGPRETLPNDDYRIVHNLLLKYNGSYETYMERLNDANKRKLNAVKLGSHIKFEHAGKVISTDIDIRVKQILDEIARIMNYDGIYVNTDVMHGVMQRFPVKVARLQLEDELDRILIEQIKERERAERARRSKVEVIEDYEHDHGIVTSLAAAAAVAAESGSTTSNGIDANVMNAIMLKVNTRAKRRQDRRLHLKGESEEEQLLKAKKMISLTDKSGEALALAILQNRLGVKGCMACREKKCVWQPSYDTPKCKARKDIIDKELTRINLNKDDSTFECYMCQSYLKAGISHFTRKDLLDELTNEGKELYRMIHLNEVDKEFHDSCVCKDAYFELKSLHGYSVMLLTSNAVAALNIQHSKLIAVETANDCVELILTRMYEGWYFGEIDTAKIGVVDDVSEEQKELLLAIDAADSSAAFNESMNKKIVNNSRSAKVTNKGTSSTAVATITGTTGTTAVAIKAPTNSGDKQKRLKVARDGNIHEQILDSTEGNLKFGLFMLTVMYFRAMTHLRNKHNMHTVKHDSNEVVAMSEHRKKEVEDEKRQQIKHKKIEAILSRSRVGDARRVDREKEEHSEAFTGLQEVVRRQKREVEAVIHLQKLYRGHVGRKAAKRWALKYFEFYAMYALCSSAAVCIQRCYRGYLDRSFAVRKRLEMGQVISLMRAQELTADEDVYWETHPLQRFKRRNREWFDSVMRRNQKTFTVGTAMEVEENNEMLLARSIEQMEDDEGDPADDNAAATAPATAVATSDST